MALFELLGDDVVKYKICSFLHGYELRKILTISKYFKKLLYPLSSYNISHLNDIKYWKSNLRRYYGNFGVWRRGWIDLSKGIFERLTNDEINQLKYYILRYEHKDIESTDDTENAVTLTDRKKEEMIPNDINSLYLYYHCKEQNDIDRKINFTANIIQFDQCKVDGNCIREIYLMNSNLNNQHIQLISNALLSRNEPSKLEMLIFHTNEFITDQSMTLLFDAIGQKAPYFKNLDISQTRCGDKICEIIYNFYYKYKDETRLQRINIENVLHLISSNGIKKLEQIIIDNLIPNNIQNEFMIRTKEKTIHCWLSDIERNIHDNQQNIVRFNNQSNMYRFN